MLVTDTLQLVGKRKIPDETQIQVNTGWNMISYLGISSRSPVDVFAPYINNIIIVKSGQGQVYWPQYSVNLMGLMYPGLGYQLKSTQSFGLYYPAD